MTSTPFRAPPSHGSFFTELQDQVRWRRQRLAREAWIMVALGIIALAAYAGLEDPRLLVMGVVAVAASLGVMAFVRINPDRSRVLDTLQQRADYVVWIFLQEGSQTASRAALVFALEDGTSLTLTVDPTRRDALLQRASETFATATIGFSAASRQQFLVDPKGLRVAPRAAPVGIPSRARNVAWLVAHARVTQRGMRWLGWLGVSMFALCAFAMVIVLGAAEGEERNVLATVFGVLAALAVAMAAWGLRRFEHTALFRALTTEVGLTAVQYVDGHDSFGNVIPMAMVTLASGHRYTFPIPHKPQAR